MKALVTGASGFVGRHLVAHLLARGDAVVALDRSLDGNAEPDGEIGQGEAGQGDAGVERLAVDITDAEAVGRAVHDAQADAVYHLAARSHVGESWQGGDELTRVNVGGTQAVLDACRRAGVTRVLVVGSAEQYGPVPADHGPVREDTPMRPLSPYGVSKRDAEVAAFAAARRDGLAVVCVRAFNHTGPGQDPSFFVPGFAGRIARAEADPDGDDQIAVGNLDSVRDFTDVRDVVRAYRLLVEHGAPGEAYNVCSGRGVRVGEIAERLLARARRPLRLRVDPELVRPVEVPVFVGDDTKLVTATGWRRELDLDRTLDDVLAEARARVTRGSG